MAATAPRGGVAPNTRRVMNLAHFLRKNARRLPDAAGLVQGGRVWSWGELDARVDAMAAALAGRGVVKGDRVLVQSRNGHQLFESMFVCFRLGAVWVPTNYRQTPAEVAYLAKASGARALICGSVFPEHAAAIRAECPDLDVVVEIGGASFGEDYDGLVAAHDGQAAPVADVEHDDPCWFFFTSGTTGRPKAAVLTHGQMGFVITNHLCDLMPGTTEADASLVVAPLSHGAGIHQLAQVAAGATTVLTAGERLDPEEAWSLVAQWRVANMFTVPTIVKILTEHPAVERHDRSSLRHVIYAGAPMYREDQKRALRALGPVLVQYFGLGEVTGNITVLPPRLHAAEDGPGVKVGTCGFERTGMQVDIQDPEGRSLPPARPARSASAARRSSRATTTTRRPMPRRSAMAGSARATSAISTGRDSCSSPAAPPTCTSPAAPTCTRAKPRRSSSNTQPSRKPRSSGCRTRPGARSAWRSAPCGRGRPWRSLR